ncbi:DNA-binding XRE family transcriptional regulator [Mucilaginibacter frigoritolerans]|uniref:DNA-binding XRE family transcriptional regulator n=1 Tax=Mucilaginibacter frigoritolerans TaxID=652788 RepID=A0A562UAC2_9SPHI|nr:helix-turn-helix transcriptional regulator [Mucilaginibacter frigoritolerans]TWJ02205.1 DNA-binding XRE family transcriptional regulator [Mucilaginibacter frigoritolerans]
MQKERYDTFLKTVGNNVRSIRIEKGLTMEALANEAEIEYRQLGRIERGEVNTTIVSLLKIANVLEVNVSTFLLS